jgi:hypothetical protein
MRMRMIFHAMALSIAAMELQAEPASVVYASRARNLEENGILWVREWVFSSATDRIVGASLEAESIATEIAKVRADAGFLDASIDLSQGRPVGITSQLEAAVKNCVATSKKSTLKLSGIVTVAEETRKGSVRVVRAVPAANVRLTPTSWSSAVAFIESSCRSLSDFAILCEIKALNGERKVAQREFNRRVMQELGIQTQFTPCPVPDGWFLLGSAEIKSATEKFAIDGITKLLARRPYDESLTKRLAGLLVDRGLIVASEAVSEWPVLSWTDDSSAERSVAAAQGFFSGEAAVGRFGLLRVMAVLGEKWPAFRDVTLDSKAVLAFQEGRIEDALALFTDELSRAPSAESANYVAACFLALRQPSISMVFSSIALRWNPSHPHAAGNHMLALVDCGDLGTAHVVAREIVKNPSSSGWAKQKAEFVLRKE